MEIDRIIINKDKAVESSVVVIGQLKPADKKKGTDAVMARRKIVLTKEQEAQVFKFVEGLITL